MKKIICNVLILCGFHLNSFSQTDTKNMIYKDSLYYSGHVNYFCVFHMDTLTLEEYQDKYLDILINGIKERYQLEGEIYPLGFEDYNRGLVAMDQFTLIDENGKVFHGSLVIHEKWYQFNNGSMEIIVIH